MAAANVMIDRAATAIRRNGTSRPLALALINQLIADGDRVLDYGCGHGEDVAYLADRGYDAHGWDPHHRPDGDLSPADVVLCSYVLNVIESPAERLTVLREVHRLAARVTVVAVRTTAEKNSLNGCDRHGDGWITAKNTFQTLWNQTDARTLIQTATDTPPVALAPGVFAVFKTPAAEEAWREAVGDRIRRARIHRGPAIHRPGVLEQIYDDHRDAFDALWAWVEERRRLPEDNEVPAEAEPAVEAAGSVGRAGLVLRHVKDTSDGLRRAGAHERTYEAHRDAFDALWAWVEERGRLPENTEVPVDAVPAIEAAGSVGQAGQVLRHVHDPDPVRRAGKREIAYDQHRDAFDALLEFALAHGRLPEDDELPTAAQPAVDQAGSVGHAGLVLREVFGTELVDEAADERRQALTIRFALARLRRRPKFTDLPRTVQRDVRALFGSYKAACERADELLFAVGDPATLKTAAATSPVGKRTSDALYVHATALDLLPAEFRIYDACARVIAGDVDGANLVKFHLDKPRVSYLVYPDFDTDPHPALAESWVADLRELDLRPHDYRQRDNPPVLHRKELFVAADHPRHTTFARLTEQEERHGLLDEVLTIGTRCGWNGRLEECGWALRGHRLVRAD